MKKTLFIMTALSIAGCGNPSSSDNGTKDSVASSQIVKSAKEMIRMDTIKVDKAAGGFYAICADEHFGWCSTKLSTYDEASSALKRHKDSTGHTDNSVSNDCPFK